MHDLGGVPKFMCEPVDTEPHALTDFDPEVDALRAVLGAKQIMTVDEFRCEISLFRKPTICG
jgi:nitrile hydratase subunit beta